MWFWVKIFENIAMEVSEYLSQVSDRVSECFSSIWCFRYFRYFAHTSRREPARLALPRSRCSESFSTCTFPPRPLCGAVCYLWSWACCSFVSLIKARNWCFVVSLFDGWKLRITTFHFFFSLWAWNFFFCFDAGCLLSVTGERHQRLGKKCCESFFLLTRQRVSLSLSCWDSLSHLWRDFWIE